MPERIATIDEFRAALQSGSRLVITDAASKAMFHRDPVGCSHVQEHSFETKVVKNAEKNGRYFAVKSLQEARERWPEVPVCRSSACSSALD